MSELNQTALKIVSNDKGILAADESNPSMIKKFDSINVKSNPENRLKYREILFSAEVALGISEVEPQELNINKIENRTKIDRINMNYTF